MMPVLRAFLKEPLEFPQHNLVFEPGQECFIGQQISGSMSAITIIDKGKKFALHVNNNMLILDSSHIDLGDFHTAMWGAGYDE